MSTLKNAEEEHRHKSNNSVAGNQNATQQAAQVNDPLTLHKWMD